MSVFWIGWLLGAGSGIAVTSTFIMAWNYLKDDLMSPFLWQCWRFAWPRQANMIPDTRCWILLIGKLYFLYNKEPWKYEQRWWRK